MWDKAGGLLLAACTLTACALDQVGSIYAAPGKYDTVKCPDLTAFSISLSQREKELNSLMDRANQDATGPVVNALIYSPEFERVRANLASVKKAAADKNCDK